MLSGPDLRGWSPVRKSRQFRSQCMRFRCHAKPVFLERGALDGSSSKGAFRTRMKIGIFTALFHDRPIEEAFDLIAAAGIQAVEIGAGAYPGSRHINDVRRSPKSSFRRRSAKKAREARLRSRTRNRLDLGSWQPTSPELRCCQRSSRCIRERRPPRRKTSQGRLIIREPVLNGFSGCPGDSPRAKYPSWVTCPWPDEFREVLDWRSEAPRHSVLEKTKCAP